MFHRNYWVTRAKGPEKWFDKLLRGSRKRYREIFVDCDAGVLEAAAAGERKHLREQIRTSFVRYRKLRAHTKTSANGILTPDRCARELYDIMQRQDVRFGLVSITAGGAESVRTKFVPFDVMDRLEIVEEANMAAVGKRGQS